MKLFIKVVEKVIEMIIQPKIIAQPQTNLHRFAPIETPLTMDLLDGLEDHYLSPFNLPADRVRAEVRTLGGIIRQNGGSADARTVAKLARRFNDSKLCRAAHIQWLRDMLTQNTKEEALLLYQMAIKPLMEQMPQTEESQRFKTAAKILGARCESEPKKIVAAWQKLQSSFSSDNILYTYLSYCLVKELIGQGLLPEAERAIEAIDQHQGTNDYPEEILGSILTGDIRLLQGRYKDAAFNYYNAKDLVQEALQNQGLVLVSYGKNYKPGDLTLEVIHTLLLAACIKEANARFLAQELDEANSSYFEAKLYADLAVPLRLGQRGKDVAYALLAEHEFENGDLETARRHFAEAGTSLLALTRLNELDLAQADQLTRDQAQQTFSRLYREIRLRESFGETSAGTNLLVARLHHFRVAVALQSPERLVAPLRALEQQEDHPVISTMALLRHVSLPKPDAGVADRAREVNLDPARILAAEPEVALAAEILFGLKDMEQVVEHLQATLTGLRQASTTEDTYQAPETEVYQPLLETYNAREANIQAAFEQFWQESPDMFNLDVWNPFRALDHSGIMLFNFYHREGQMTLRINDVEGRYCEIPFNGDFNFELTTDGEFNRLFRFIIMDMFLTYQQAPGYRSVLSTVSFDALAESDWLTTLGVARKAADLDSKWVDAIVSRPPSPSERALDTLAEGLEETPVGTGETTQTPPAETPAEEAMHEDKKIFRHLVLPHLQTRSINISTEVSLDPLAAYLHHMDITPRRDRSTIIRIECEGGFIRVTLQPDGRIEITNQNQGQLDVALMRRLNKVILETLNFHFNKAYKTAVRTSERQAGIHAVYVEAETSSDAAAEKIDIWQATPPARRHFCFVGVKTSDNPFEAAFFEEEKVDGGPDRLTPLPTMTIAQAAEAVAAGREIIQIMSRPLRLMAQNNPIPEARIREYIWWERLGEKQTPFAARGEAGDKRIDREISALVRNKKTDRFLRRDTSHPVGLSFADRHFDGERLTISTEKTWVVEHLVRWPVARTGYATKPKPAGVPTKTTEPEKPHKPRRGRPGKGRRKRGGKRRGRGKGAGKGAPPTPPKTTPAAPEYTGPTTPVIVPPGKDGKPIRQDPTPTHSDDIQAQLERNDHSRQALTDLAARGITSTIVAERLGINPVYFRLLSEGKFNASQELVVALDGLLDKKTKGKLRIKSVTKEKSPKAQLRDSARKLIATKVPEHDQEALNNQAQRLIQHLIDLGVHYPRIMPQVGLGKDELSAVQGRTMDATENVVETLTEMLDREVN